MNQWCFAEWRIYESLGLNESNLRTWHLGIHNNARLCCEITLHTIIYTAIFLSLNQGLTRNGGDFYASVHFIVYIVQYNAPLKSSGVLKSHALLIFTLCRLLFHEIFWNISTKSTHEIQSAKDNVKAYWPQQSDISVYFECLLPTKFI